MTAILLFSMVFSAVFAAPPLPFERYGTADVNSTYISSWIDGVEYGNATTTAAGAYTIDTVGDDTVGGDNIRTGGVAGNIIQYARTSLTGTAARFFTQTDTWSVGGSTNGPLTSEGSDTSLLKIAIINPQPTVAAMGDYIALYNPTGAAVDVTSNGWGIAIGVGATHTIVDADIMPFLTSGRTNPIPAASLLYLNLSTAGWATSLSTTGNSIKLYYNTHIVDRVEYGTIATEPENTLMSNAALPAAGQEAYRTPSYSTDTNKCLPDFTTRAQTVPYDNTHPQISTIVPNDGAIGVALNAQVVVTWSEAMNNAVGSVNINPARTGAWAWSGGFTIYTFTPGGNWAESTLYTLTFSSFTDVSGRAATGDLVKVFTTGDFTGPTISTIVPNDFAVGVAQGTSVVVTWSETMNTLVGSVNWNTAPTGGSWAWSGGITYTFSGATYASLTMYQMTFTGFTDTSANAATGDLVKQFTTADYSGPGGTTPNVVWANKTGGVVRLEWSGGAAPFDIFVSNAVDGTGFNFGSPTVTGVSNWYYTFNVLGDGNSYGYIVLGQGDSTTPHPNMAFKFAKSITTPLSPNINRVAIPYRYQYTTLGTIAADIGNAITIEVQAWDVTNQIYRVVTFDDLDMIWTGATGFVLGPGAEVLIFCQTPGIWDMVGATNPSQSLNILTPLAPNINFLGLPINHNYLNLGAVAASIGNGITIEVQAWDLANQIWRVVTFDDLDMIWTGATGFAMQPGSSVLVFCQTPGVWNPTETNP